MKADTIVDAFVIYNKVYWEYYGMKQNGRLWGSMAVKNGSTVNNMKVNCTIVLLLEKVKVDLWL